MAPPSTAIKGGPTTARGRRTRSALVTAAREVFEDVGFRDARISEIATRAGTSYGVFYNYFTGKDAIFDEVFTGVMGEMFSASQAPTGVGDPVEKIRASNRRYLTVAARNARLIAVLEELALRDPQFRDLKLRMREPFLRRIEAGIRRFQEQGIADAHLDPRMAASLLGGMIEHFSMLWFIHDADFDEDVAVDTLTRLWAHALGLQEQAGDDRDVPVPATG